MQLSIGFTGTRKGMTLAQHYRFREVIAVAQPTEFHFGGCRGADSEAAFMVSVRTSARIIVHPCDLDPQIHGPYNERRRSLPPLTRNRNIVKASQKMIATPSGFMEIGRSGTWATIRFARKQGKPLVIIWPDGSTDVENEVPR